MSFSQYWINSRYKNTDTIEMWRYWSFWYWCSHWWPSSVACFWFSTADLKSSNNSKKLHTLWWWLIGVKRHLAVQRNILYNGWRRFLSSTKVNNISFWTDLWQTVKFFLYPFLFIDGTYILFMSPSIGLSRYFYLACIQFGSWDYNRTSAIPVCHACYLLCWHGRKCSHVLTGS